MWGVDGDTSTVTKPLFDVASLTKVLATVPIILSLIVERRLHLLTRLAQVFPENRDTPAASITVADLLTHTAALRSSTRLDLYPSLLEPATVLMTEPLAGEPGVMVNYGNRAFILLGLVAERLTGENLPALFEGRVRQEMHMPHACYRPSNEIAVVPLKRDYSGEIVHRVPYDRNAELLGGAAGHSGLYCSLADLMAFGEGVCAMWQFGTVPMSSYLRLIFAPWYRENSAFRGLGWQLARTRDRLIPFHHGFTGGSIILVPEAGVVLGVLTDSVNFGERQPELDTLRQRLLRLVVDF